ncbi:MAG: hypothetical protein HYV63_17045 [Candidatus Schekmanbacteria bacterium]|nr:hypothetical protein [Candidatus Schekmanbacteria bacterium]
MVENRIDLVLSPEQLAEAVGHLQALDALCSGFDIALTDEERRSLPKLGDKSLAFVTKALEAAETHADLLARNFDIADFRRDVTLYQQGESLSLRLVALQRALDDATMQAGSEAFQAALLVYGYLQKQQDSDPGVSAMVTELGERFAAQRRKRTPRTSP